MKWTPKDFNDFLCLFLITMIMILWLLIGIGILTLPETVIGATIVTWTLLVNYYFRKAPTEKH
jgi:hypothetical protein